MVATQIFFMFTPKTGEDEAQFDVRIFFRWVGEKPPRSEVVVTIFNPAFDGIRSVLSFLEMLQETRVHVAMDAWIGGYMNTYLQFQDDQPLIAPIDVGNQGYLGARAKNDKGWDSSMRTSQHGDEWSDSF